MLYLAPDFGTWVMDNSLKLASWTEDFHLWVMPPSGDVLTGLASKCWGALGFPPLGDATFGWCHLRVTCLQWLTGLPSNCWRAQCCCDVFLRTLGHGRTSWTEESLKLFKCHVLWTELALELYPDTLEIINQDPDQILSKWPEFCFWHNLCGTLFGPQIQGKVFWNIQAWADI